VRVGTVNLASGRGPAGVALSNTRLAAAVSVLDVDVLAVQELDCGQPRSHGSDQAAVLAEALLASDWRYAATLTGVPGPTRTWHPVSPPSLRGPGEPTDGPSYGIALLSRRPVHRWSAIELGAGRARLPMKAPDPRTGRLRWWWIPDEPRVAVAANLGDMTVIATHLSFAPHTAARQLRRLRRWATALPGPVLVAGDLNLPGALPGRLLGGRSLVRAATYPAGEPRVQLDHLTALGNGLVAEDEETRVLDVGDHRAVAATVRPA
jgi:endonuclease/exonuclease/phosphatase family metal-dependent hydrolase